MSVRVNRSCPGLVPLLLLAVFPAALFAISSLPGERQESRATARPPASALVRPASPAKPAGADGFIQRWLLLEPVRVPGQLTEIAVRTAVEKDFAVPATPLPHDGDTLKVGDREQAQRHLGAAKKALASAESAASQRQVRIASGLP